MNWCSGSRKLHLQGGDSIIVQRGHLLLRQGVSCLVVDLKPCVELQHVQQLQDDIKKKGQLADSVCRHTAVLVDKGASFTWQKRCPSFSREGRLDRWQLTTR